MCSLALVLAAIAGLPVATSRAVPAPRDPWTSPEWVAFEHGEVEFGTLEVALDDDGHGLVVFSERTPYRAIYAASITPQGPLGLPVLISSRAPASAPKVAMASGGRAVIAWSAGASRARCVEAVTRAGPTDAFTAPRRLSRRSRHVLNDVALEPSGEAMVAWTRVRGHRTEAQVARLGARVDVRSLGDATHSPALAVSAQRPHASLAWARSRGEGSELWLERNGGPPIRVSRTRRAASAPALAAGRVVVTTWLEGRARVDAVLKTAWVASDGRLYLDELANGAIGNVSVASGGPDMAVAWMDHTLASAPTVHVARSTRAGPAFATDTQVSRTDSAASMPSVGVGGGRVAVVWRNVLDPPGNGIMSGAVAEPGAAFPEPTMLGEEFDVIEPISPVRLALNTHGIGLAAYLTYGGDFGVNGHVAVVSLLEK